MTAENKAKPGVPALQTLAHRSEALSLLLQLISVKAKVLSAFLRL